MTPAPLHIGGASTATVAVTVVVIFFLIFALSFAFGSVPEGGRRFSGEWLAAWLRASAQRLVVAGAFSVALFVASSLSGDGGEGSAGDDALVCASPVAPLSAGPVSDGRIQGAAEALSAAADAAKAGDIEGFRVLFLGETHNLTHDIDAAVRPADRDLAASICRQVLVIEREVVADAPDMGRLEDAAVSLADLLEQARSPDGVATPTPLLVSPCEFPLPKLTDSTVSGERLRNAISGMRSAAAAARRGDQQTVRDLLIGDAHALTHDIDEPLRAVDAQLATELCKAITEVEVQASRDFDQEVITAQANLSANLLAEAGKALGVLE